MLRHFSIKQCILFNLSSIFDLLSPSVFPLPRFRMKFKAYFRLSLWQLTILEYTSKLVSVELVLVLLPQTKFFVLNEILGTVLRHVEQSSEWSCEGGSRGRSDYSFQKVNLLFIQMDKHNKKKIISLKKIDDILLHQEQIKQDKHYNPGQVQFTNTPLCTARVVNFFGDIHTEVFSIRVNSNDKAVGVGCSNGQVKVYDIYEGKVLSINNTSRMSGFPCTSIRWKPILTDDFVACNCDGTIKWYKRNQETAYGHFEKNEVSYLCSDYQAKEEWCIFGTDQNTIDIFDNKTMKLTQNYEAGGPSELSFNHHTNRVFCVKCLPKDPAVFFSGGWDSTVQIWDIRVGNGSVRKICGPSVSSDSLDFKNGVLLAGNYQNNNIVQTYDYGTGNLIQTLDINEPHNSNSYCFAAAFAHRSEHNLIAVGLTGSNKVKILRDNKLACEMKFQASPLTLDFYRLNGKDFLVVGGIEGTIYCIKLDLSK